MLVFLNTKKDHNNIAYEFFTNDGPLAILPAPASSKIKKSTFIYSSKKKINKISITKTY